jgi:hypothetical protein
MSANDKSPMDALEFVAGALDALPDDPADATLDDLRVIVAASEGLARHTLALRANMAALARRALDCGDDLAELREIAVERGRLEAQHQRAVLADQRFTTYSREALSAHGFNLDQLMAGH